LLTRVSWSVGQARLTKFSLFIRVMDVSATWLQTGAARDSE